MNQHDDYDEPMTEDEIAIDRYLEELLQGDTQASADLEPGAAEFIATLCAFAQTFDPPSEFTEQLHATARLRLLAMDLPEANDARSHGYGSVDEPFMGAMPGLPNPPASEDQPVAQPRPVITDPLAGDTPPRPFKRST